VAAASVPMLEAANTQLIAGRGLRADTSVSKGRPPT